MIHSSQTACFLLAIAAGSVGAARSQEPAAPVHVAIGFGVDTAGPTNHEVFALWRRYLESRPNCMDHSPDWSPAEQAQWPVEDLLCPYVFQGFPVFTVVHLAPAVGLDSTFLIRTLAARVADSVSVQPLAFFRVYAKRAGGRWVLANALPILTRRWNHETIGMVSFVYPPGRAFSRPRAEATAAFVDFLVREFQVPPPRGIGYYFTDDMVQTFAAAGLDFFPIGSDTVGGRANNLDRLVWIGSSSNGEGYRHEVAHVVLWPFLAPFHASGLLQEGLMTWVGGSAGLDFKALMPGLEAYLDAHPDLTLATLFANPPARVGALDVGYDGAAVLCEMVFRADSLEGIRTLAAAGREPSAVLSAAARLLKVPEGGLDRAWRERIVELAR